jgi:large subunit ribosomal protein L28
MFKPTLSLLKNTSRSAFNPKRLQTGLYDGRSIQSGNNVGETFNNKTRRTWLPNVHSKALWSEALGQKLRLKVTAGALRTIDKVGGLDAYLFRMKPERLGQKGMELRQRVSCPFLSGQGIFGHSLTESNSLDCPLAGPRSTREVETRAKGTVGMR